MEQMNAEKQKKNRIKKHKQAKHKQKQHQIAVESRAADVGGAAATADAAGGKQKKQKNGGGGGDKKKGREQNKKAKEEAAARKQDNGKEKKVKKDKDALEKLMQLKKIAPDNKLVRDHYDAIDLQKGSVLFRNDDDEKLINKLIAEISQFDKLNDHYLKKEKYTINNLGRFKDIEYSPLHDSYFVHDV